MSRSITVLKGAPPQPNRESGSTEITFDELKGWARDGTLFRRLFSYREARLLVHAWETTSKRFATAVLLRMLSRGRCYCEDADGQRHEITAAALGLLGARLARETMRRRRLLADAAAAVRRLSVAETGRRRDLDLSRSPLYLRTDLWFGIRAGGSVGHIAGVLNHLDAFAGPPVFVTTDVIPTVRADVERHTLDAASLPWELSELPSLAFNESALGQTMQALSGRRPAFVYQRYSLNNSVGLSVARDAAVPFVLEYNGSEVWINRNWGRPLRYESLSLDFERLNLRAADLVIVVSEAIADQLRRDGIPEERILVNPNGVDTDLYHPDVDARQVRTRLALDGHLVVGFIGTFGPWHGAEVLAHAFVQLLSVRPELRDRVRLLMIGDGPRLAQTRAILEHAHVLDACIFTGLVPQAEGPAHLAACDVLVSPHVPNPDGTPFFGSPTKLFEYMAMGRAIVASALDQLDDVLDDNLTAVMVAPGDVAQLATGIGALLDDPDRRSRLGALAREVAVNRYTWRAHTGRTVTRLQELTNGFVAEHAASP